ncbi:MAG: DUF2953 domain-containing protein [Blautia sp.]|jgi:hypothetical protein
MLHILWLIIKFILVLLGILLGLILLILLAVLFVPVRYRAWGEKSKTSIQAKANVSWLFHGISFWFWYEQGNASQDLKIFGISMNRVRAWRSRRRSAKEEKKRLQLKKEAALEENVPLQTEKESVKPVLEEKAGAETPVNVENVRPPMADAVNTDKKEGMLQDDGGQEKPPEGDASEETDQAGPLPEKKKTAFDKIKRLLGRIAAAFQNICRKIAGVLQKLLGLPRKILAKLKKISLTIQGIYDKISYWRAFVQDERTKAAIHLVFSQLKHLLKHMAPTKLSGRVKFGMEDPFVTGEILAGLGMTYPLHKNRIQVMPVFDEKILVGEAQCKGRIYGIVLVIAAWKLYFDKNIKYVRKRWNHKEG